MIFSNYETDPLQRAVRPQLLEAEVQRELKRYNQLSIVDQETAPTLLQVDILRSAIKWYDRTVPHVRRIEQSIWSKWKRIMRDIAYEQVRMRHRRKMPRILD